MNNLLLLVPASACDSMPEITGVTLKSLPLSPGGPTEWPSLSEVRKLATTHSHAATTANTNAAIIREMLGRLDDRWHNMSTAIVCADEPVPADIRTILPECLHQFLRRSQPRDLVVASRAALESTGAGTMQDISVVPGTISLALPRVPAIDRFPPVGPGSGSPEIKLTDLNSAIRKAVDSLQLGSLDHRCVEAGLLLLQDFLGESHHISQTMEGKGSPRTGDYWHGIMHRREPDAGNASYWFRRVGQHPALDHLGNHVIDWMSELGATARQVDLARCKLLSVGTFDPFAMIQLSERALLYPGSDEDLTCRMVQYLEMLNLLSWSSRADDTSRGQSMGTPGKRPPL